jgi:dienelactone hydrolase
MISIDSDLDGGPLPAYRAEPVGELRGAVIVIHEIWGLVDHIKSVADRYAAQGYLVIAPDILSHGGVTPEVGEELTALQHNPSEEERAKAQPIMRESWHRFGNSHTAHGPSRRCERSLTTSRRNRESMAVLGFSDSASAAHTVSRSRLLTPASVARFRSTVHRLKPRISHKSTVRSTPSMARATNG